MKKDFTIHGETLCASQERALMIEQYLQDHFEFRNNVLNGISKIILNFATMCLTARWSSVLKAMRITVL